MPTVFSGGVVEVPTELVAAGSRTPSPKTKASQLVARFLGTCPSTVSVRLAADDLGHLAYSHANQALLRPRGQSLTSLTATTSTAVPSIVQAVPEKAETALAGKDADAGVVAAARRGEREKVDESVAAVKPSSEEAEKCGAVAAVDQRRAREEVAADNIGTETEEEEPWLPRTKAALR